MLRRLGARNLCQQFRGQERSLEPFCSLRVEGNCDIFKTIRYFRSISSLVSFPPRHHDVRSLGPIPRPIQLLTKNPPPVIAEKVSFSKSALQSVNTENFYPGGSLVRSESEMASSMEKTTLENLNFDNKVLRDLPVDESVNPRTQRQVHGACFTSAHQEPLENPETVAVSQSALALLGLSESEAVKDEFAEYFSGSKAFVGSKPAAHCYCGHQFGYFSGQLGDGAAM